MTKKVVGVFVHFVRRFIQILVLKLGDGGGASSGISELKFPLNFKP
jgi:hypothetical protein